MSSIFATVAAVSLLAAAPTKEDAVPAASPSATDSAQTRYYPLTLELSTDALKKHTAPDVVERHGVELRDGLRELFALQKLEVVDDSSGAASLKIELAWVNAKGLTYDVNIDCTRPDGGTHSIAFELLGDHFDVLMRVEAEMSKIRRCLEAPAAQPTSPPQPEHGGSAPRTAEDPPRPGVATTKRIGPVGWVGVGFLAAGVGTVVAGAVDLGRGEVAEPKSTPGSDAFTDHRPRGRTLLGVGAGVAAVGAVMMGLDLGLRARKRRQERRASPSFQLNRDYAGIGLRGRF